MSAAGRELPPGILERDNPGERERCGTDPPAASCGSVSARASLLEREDADLSGILRQVFAAPSGLVFRFIYIDALYDAAHIAAFKASMEKWIEKF